MSSPQRSIVTGAAGYIGRHVVSALLDDGVEVTAVVRPGSSKAIDPRATVVACDVLADDFAVTQLADEAPTSLVHLAWQDGFSHNAPSHMELLSAHYRFLQRAAAWQGLERLAALGTMHECGYVEGAIDEDTPTRPLSLYGAAKDALRASTQIAFGGRDDLSYQWLRCFYIYGDDRGAQSIFAKLLQAADDGKTSFPFTTGKNLYDFLPVEELGRQIAAVVQQSAVTGTINCCSGEPQSLADRVTAYIAEHGLPLTLEYGAFPDRPYDSPGVWGDATKIRAVMAAHQRRA